MMLEDKPTRAETAERIRKELWERTPDQWVITLGIAEDHLDEYGFDSLADFCSAKVADGGLSMTANELYHMLYYRRAYWHKADALVEKIKIKELTDLVKEVRPLEGHGSGPGRGHKRGYTKNNITSFMQRGTSAEYRIAKLKRDHPEIAQRLENGEFKSVSEAERAAGIREPLPGPVEKAIRYFDRLDAGTRRAVREHFNKE